MIRSLITKPVTLIVLGFGVLGVLGFATFVVLAVAVQQAGAKSYQMTPAAFQQVDDSAQNGSVADRQDPSDASMPQSGNGSAPRAASGSPSSAAASFDAEISGAEQAAQYGQGSQESRGSQYGQAAQNGRASQYAPVGYASSSSAAGWTQQALPDGSATLALPTNWRLAGGGKGAAEIDGPNSEQVILGLQTFVMANQAPYMAPEQALAWFMRSHGVQLLGVQNQGEQRTGSGQAELMIAQSEIQGRRYKVVARVTTSPIGMGNWMLQISSMGSPVERFDADFPTMQKIWNSWQLDRGYVQGGFNTAARIHQRTTQMAVDHAESTIHQWDGFNEQMDQNIRGVSTMENSTLGKRYETQIGSERRFLDNCTRRGQDCRQVPTNQLVQPQ